MLIAQHSADKMIGTTWNWMALTDTKSSSLADSKRLADEKMLDRLHQTDDAIIEVSLVR